MNLNETSSVVWLSDYENHALQESGIYLGMSGQQRIQLGLIQWKDLSLNERLYIVLITYQTKFVRGTGTPTLLGQWQRKQFLDQKCLVIHTPCLLFKCKSQAMILKNWEEILPFLFVLLPCVSIMNTSLFFAFQNYLYLKAAC